MSGVFLNEYDLIYISHYHAAAFQYTTHTKKKKISRIESVKTLEEVTVLLIRVMVNNNIPVDRIKYFGVILHTNNIFDNKTLFKLYRMIV